MKTLAIAIKTDKLLINVAELQVADDDCSGYLAIIFIYYKVQNNLFSSYFLNFITAIKFDNMCQVSQLLIIFSREIFIL